MPKKQIIKKQQLDKFYTKPSIAKECYNILLPFVQDDDIIIEPSAGNGAFLQHIRCPKIAYDIAPEHIDITQGDWFEQTIPENSIVLGNPPFGSKNDLTKRFIKHALHDAKIIAFVLPMVFRKETLQKTFPDNWKLVVDRELPFNSFLLNDENYHVPTTFQIWVKRNIPHYSDYYPDLRESVKPKIQITDFSFVDKEKADFFIFGAAPHNIIKPIDVTSCNRGYYIKTLNPMVEEIIKQIPWKKYALSSVNGGSAWFTKQQIINIFFENKP